MRARPTRVIRRGVVAIFVAVCLTVFIGIAAFSLDGGMMLLSHRKARSAADAAAMAAACELYRIYPTYQGKDHNEQAYNSALDVARANGYDDDDSDVQINIPPKFGPYKDKDGYAEVILTTKIGRGFSRIFGKNKLTIKARAVSRGAWTDPKAGIIILDYDDSASLNAQGNGAFTETGAPVIVNSNNANALVTTGNGSMIAQEFQITGGVKVSNSANLTTSPVADQVFTGVHPTPDPLAYLPPPSVPADGTITEVSLGQGNKLYTLTPGRHTNLPTFNTGDVVVLRQASVNSAEGIYYIDGGGFKSTGATITMDSTSSGGMMLYNNPASNAASEKIQITGNAAGKVNLAGLTSGQYEGMVLWQNRNATVDLLVEGNGDFSVKGTFYAAGAKLNVNGNGKTSAGGVTGYYYDENGVQQNGVSQTGSQFIVKNLSLGGNGNIRLDYRSPYVARTRIITLVE